MGDFSINVNGTLMDLSVPKVMGILNVTPDSFYAESRVQGERAIIDRVAQILDEGGDIIDIGAYSSRPNADDVSTEEEMRRLDVALRIIEREFGNKRLVLSVDTFRADVARMCVEEHGVAMVNDIAAGEMDGGMFAAVAHLRVPYVMMHMKGTPANMQDSPHYENLFQEVFFYFAERVDRLRQMGANDIILDPGFGFGKTMEDNYRLMANLDKFEVFGLPVLVGVSRKSMIYRFLGITPQEALNGTTVLNTVALLGNASILRVHDVRQAVEAVKITEKIKGDAGVF